ncbi:hypothetical protein ANO11243_047500 [Dothideomycetidae sp. 11243]|nr:hypothetical protein ANO11243_047500 [fungal sp. No.11243]
MAHSQNGNTRAALDTLQCALPYIKEYERTVLQHNELHRWATRILTEVCVLKAIPAQLQATIQSMNGILAEYQTWSLFSQGAPPEASTAMSILRVWDAYHIFLSDVLRSNIIYSGPDRAPLAHYRHGIAREKLVAARNKQFVELQRAEEAYETKLMRSTAFPTAHESNKEYEVFVNRALTNWRIIMSSEWTDADLGAAGKVAYSRRVLEMLYRASTKTFHSTPVLRHLFHVHAQLGEFDLAIGAFNSYTEIVAKGKARAEKTGKHEIGLDDDDTVLYTASEAIKILCLYGERNEAEQAYEYGELVTSWLQQRRPRSSSSASHGLDSASAKERVAAETFSTPSARAAAHRAIGHSQATWARYACEPMFRQDLQEDAISNLQRSMMLASSSGVDLETAYLLAYSQAERRQTKAALETLKGALSHDRIFSPARVLANSVEERFEDRRRKFPLMHLFVLLLSARGEFDAACSLCEVTMEQLIGAARACDEADALTTLNGTNGVKGNRDLPKRLTRTLEDTEKEAFLQMKITEMELLVLTDNISYVATKKQDLIKMYEQLFGNPGSAGDAEKSSNNVDVTPKSRAGTVKSFRHSVFGRPKSSRRSPDAITSEKHPPLPDQFFEKQTESNAPTVVHPPSVTITGADGEKVGEGEAKGTISRLSMSIRKATHRHPHEVRRMASEDSMNDRRAFSHPPPMPSSTGVDRGQFRQVQTMRSVDFTADSTNGPRPLSRASTNESFATADHALPANNTEAQHDNHDSNTEHQAENDPTQALRVVDVSQLPVRTPPPLWSELARSTHRITVLIEVWLFVSNMYMRENLYSDASAAVDEAQKLVELLQAETAKVESSGRAWMSRGWGLGRPINRLLADAWAQKGLIYQTTSGPHKALSCFERSLVWYQDHPIAIPALSSILFDMHDGLVPLEPTDPSEDAVLPSKSPLAQTTPPTTNPNAPPTPDELNRIACRDRGRTLCSVLSKLGSSWDDPQVWFLLGRAAESEGLHESAQDCFWWVVELEDSAPVRHWRCVGGLV